MDKHIQLLCKPLAEIVQAEIKLGNIVGEVSEGWPYAETIFVSLHKPFKGTYYSGELEYAELNDPHYWKAEYFHAASKHILVCGFANWP